MDMSNIEPNSHKYNAEKAELEARIPKKVIEGQTKTRHKGLGRRFMDIFSMTSTAEVKDYLIKEVIIPMVKDGLYDIFDSAIRMKFFGERGGRPKKGSTLGSRTNYGDYFISSKPDKPKPKVRQETDGNVFDYEDVAFNDKGDASLALDSMLESLDRYGSVTVAEFYSAIGKTPSPIDYKYGWKDLNSAKISGDSRHGYWISFPRAQYLD